MRRELLLLGEMIGAAERACDLVDGIGLEALERDRMRQEALLWNCTVLGEAAAQLGADVKGRFPEVAWARPVSLSWREIIGSGCGVRDDHLPGWR